MSALKIVCGVQPGEPDRRFAALARFLGVDAGLVQAGEGMSSDGLAAQIGPGVTGLALSAATLVNLTARWRADASALAAVATGERFLFVYGFEPGTGHPAALQQLTRGAARSMVTIGPGGGDRCSFPAAGRAFTRQLSGAQFTRPPGPAERGFQIEAAGPGLTTLMCLGDQASFIHARGVGAGLFLWASDSFPALDLGLPADPGLCAVYGELLPAVIFLRAAFPGRCWENPVRTARVIIDDPLLADRYGCLDYAALFRSLENLDYALTIAFIPWNYRRTTRAAARLFATHGDRLAVCVHGCDHTRNEFGAPEARLLGQKAALALWRMRQHEQRTGLPFDDVMVFPQGRFSEAAMAALRRSGYLAAVNTERVAIDPDASEMTLADELMPATNRLAGFPMFHRRYSRDQAHLAVDLFLGKPAHIVEHHEIFEDGCGALEASVRALKRMEPGLTWPPLAAALREMHVRKRGERTDLDVRFFTSRFAFVNEGDRRRSVRFAKPEPDLDCVKALHVNDRSVPFRCAGPFIEFDAELEPGERILVRVEDRAEPAEDLFRPGLGYRVKTRARRVLSELRDNHLVRHPWLLRTAKRAVRLVKASADTGQRS
jgi:hypothetical protein